MGYDALPVVKYGVSSFLRRCYSKSYLILLCTLEYSLPEELSGSKGLSRLALARGFLLAYWGAAESNDFFFLSETPSSELKLDLGPVE